MKTYEWKNTWILNSTEYIEITELSKELNKRLNSDLSGTIPQIAKELKVDEQKVAWALQGTTDCRDPEVKIGNEQGKDYFNRVIQLKTMSPRPFNDEMYFYGTGTA